MDRKNSRAQLRYLGLCACGLLLTAKGTIGDREKTSLAKNLDSVARRGVESKCDRCVQ